MTGRTYLHPELDNPDNDPVFGNQRLGAAFLLVLPAAILIVAHVAMAVFG